MSKYVYSFGDGKADGNREMKDVLGGKGAGLAEMTNLGIPVPPGFTITTDVCTHYQTATEYPAGLREQVEAAMARLDASMGRTFGDPKNPTLVSVRSGAPISMPGMMDTVLNLGLNDRTVEGLIERTGNPRFAYDSYRRFVAMFGDVVLGLKPEGHEADPFETILTAKKKERGVQLDNELDADDLKDLVGRFKEAIKQRLGQDFPEDPLDQLWASIGAVFGSWNNERAVIYRRINRIADTLGTAVNVQAMVFGNSGERSGTGVAFTRNPATGENRFYGDYLMNAQGEDVVAGIRTPLPIDSLEQEMPEAYRQLSGICEKLERHYCDMLDIEFTIEDSKLWMLQTRSGKRFGEAAVRIAVEMVDEGLIDKYVALKRVEADQLNQLLRPVFPADQKEEAASSGRVLAKGIDAGPGAASGMVVFTADDAVERSRGGDPVILVRVLTEPDDIGGMRVSQGILTKEGGKTSHAALVARQMGIVCVVGCKSLEIDMAKRELTVGGKVLREGDWLSIDGTSGEVIDGKLETIPSEVVQVLVRKAKPPEESPVFERYARLMSWADEVRTLRVRTNADQPDQCEEAVAFGAEGIGLTRTEHMFFGEHRIHVMRQMILADDESGRRKALEQLLPMQRQDFEGIFRVMAGRPATIRLLDPPLHEFLPNHDDEIRALADAMGVGADHIRERNLSLHESNPMLGHRGCRLGVTYPEVYETQVRAILEAACTVKAEGTEVQPEIMIPLIGDPTEMRIMRDLAVRVADDVLRERGMRLPYLVGTMIELPRACLVAGGIAEHAEFFSFGTNDLTQTTYGLSRDDIGSFLPAYLEQGIFKTDPFTSVDPNGVGRLMKVGVKEGRAVRKQLKIGICGEHGGDPSSVVFCHEIGLDYVSCSPYRVPIARLAAAQAAVAERTVAEPVGAA